MSKWIQMQSAMTWDKSHEMFHSNQFLLGTAKQRVIPLICWNWCQNIPGPGDRDTSSPRGEEWPWDQLEVCQKWPEHLHSQAGPKRNLSALSTLSAHWLSLNSSFNTLGSPRSIKYVWSFKRLPVADGFLVCLKSVGLEPLRDYPVDDMHPMSFGIQLFEWPIRSSKLKQRLSG